MTEKNSTPKEEGLREALEAAQSRDRIGMYQGIMKSMVLEAFKVFFERKYPGAGPDNLYDAMAAAVDDLVEQAVAGAKIRAIDSYLFKIIDRKLATQNKRQKRIYADADVSQLATKESQAEEPNTDYTGKAREQAIDLAESLIPRLGLVNVQNVMRYILASIKNGAEDVPSTEIADALGLTLSNVRQATKRGFDRLRNITREEKLVDESYSFPFLDDTEYYLADEANDDSTPENNDY